LLLHVLEAARVPEGALGLVVPPDARGAVRFVRVDEQERREDRVEVGLRWAEVTWTFAVSRGHAREDCHTFQKFTLKA
ncbi:MAG: hypothetical protein Q7W02_07275, partial [Candidatus Rokubacteria bacterium]|nr:hypothetical protein [Candidatus Rokubacteria bacterium]